MIVFWTIRILALALAASVAPLYFDLAVALVGNLLRERRFGAPVRPIRLAAVVPAHNEEAQIASTVRSLVDAASLALGAAGYEPTVYVVAHNCIDRTAELAYAAGAVVIPVNDLTVKGKGAALRAGFEAAAADGANGFLVVDADSDSTPNLMVEVSRILASGVDAVQTRYQLRLPAAATVFTLSRLRVLAFRGINVLRARGRSRAGFSAGLFGNGFALSAAALDRVPFAADSICEDIEYHAHLVAAGFKVHWFDHAGVSAPVSRPGAAQARQEARWEGGRLRVAFSSTPRLVASILGGHLAAFGTLTEVWSISIARGILALILAACLPLHGLHVFAAICALLTVLYALGAALLGPEPGRDLAALCLAPFHVVWKAALTPFVLLHTRRHTAWTRTQREAQRP